MDNFTDKLQQVYTNNDSVIANAEDILSSAGFVISSGPSIYDANDQDFISNFTPIGLCQSTYLSSSKNIIPAFEVGTRAKTVLSSKGPKQMMLTRVMTFQRNVLNAIYSYNLNSKDGRDYDLGSDNSIKPVGILITIMTESRKIIGHMFFSEAYVEAHAENRTAGERGIMEQCSIKWSNYKYISGGKQ